MSVSGVRCAGLRSAAAFGTAGIYVPFSARNPTELVGLLAWHQPHVIRHVVVIGDDHAALRIDRDAAPVRAAVVTRIFDRMSRRFRRRINALIARTPELDAACALIERPQSPPVAFRQDGL